MYFPQETTRECAASKQQSKPKKKRQQVQEIENPAQQYIRGNLQGDREGCCKKTPVQKPYESNQFRLGPPEAEAEKEFGMQRIYQKSVLLRNWGKVRDKKQN